MSVFWLNDLPVHIFQIFRAWQLFIQSIYAAHSPTSQVFLIFKTNVTFFSLFLHFSVCLFYNSRPASACHGLCSACTPCMFHNVASVFRLSSLQFMLYLCSGEVLSLFHPCSVWVPPTFLLCSGYIPSTFCLCSNDVPSMFWFCSYSVYIRSLFRLYSIYVLLRFHLPSPFANSSISLRLRSIGYIIQNHLPHNWQFNDQNPVLVARRCPSFSQLTNGQCCQGNARTMNMLVIA